MSTDSGELQSLFSLPKEVKATCENAKPYHFWLSATLARELIVQDRIDRESAAKATFIAQKAYQVSRDAVGSGRGNALAGTLSQQPFSPVTQVMRADLAYSASGAFFGALVAKGKETSSNIDLDESLRDLVRDANIEAPPSMDEALLTVKEHRLWAFKKWDDLLSPNSAFRSVNTRNPLK